MALVNNPVMGINLRQNKNSKNAGYGKYYPEVDMQKTLTIRGFAQHLIDHGSKYKRGDIENMLSMVTECLPELVAQGIPVQLGELGIFRPTCEAKASVENIAAMEGLNPNEVVKATTSRSWTTWPVRPSRTSVPWSCVTSSIRRRLSSMARIRLSPLCFLSPQQ